MPQDQQTQKPKNLLFIVMQGLVGRNKPKHKLKLRSPSEKSQFKGGYFGPVQIWPRSRPHHSTIDCND
jgi:hypothetical protein